MEVVRGVPPAQVCSGAGRHWSQLSLGGLSGVRSVSRRSVLERWCLLVVLALGVVAMHHAPFLQEHSGTTALGTASAAVHASGHVGSGGSDRLSASGNGAGRVVPAPLVAAEEGHSAGYGGLHPCLAVHVGAAAFLGVLGLLATIPPSSIPIRPGGQVAMPWIRPPPPVLRRLAMLCVLRL